jgi:hypothetical protein
LLVWALSVCLPIRHHPPTCQRSGGCAVGTNGLVPYVHTYVRTHVHLCVIVKTCRLLCEPSMRHVRVASVCTGRLWGWQWIVYVDTARRRCVRAPVGASLLSTPDAEGGGRLARCAHVTYKCAAVGTYTFVRLSCVRSALPWPQRAARHPQAHTC